MGKHSKGDTQEYSGDRDQFHQDLRGLPTYQVDTPYSKATEKPAPLDTERRK